MLCTTSHIYVDKVTKCCALNHIYMSPRLLKNMYVSSSVVGSYLWCDIMPVSISHRGGRRGHRERLDALAAPISTPLAPLVLASVLVAL